LILSDSPGQHYHVLTGSFARWYSPGGLGIVNFPNNHFIGYTIDEDRQRSLVTVPKENFSSGVSWLTELRDSLESLRHA